MSIYFEEKTHTHKKNIEHLSYVFCKEFYFFVQNELQCECETHQYFYDIPTCLKYIELNIRQIF